jgi:hypothetical protein
MTHHMYQIKDKAVLVAKLNNPEFSDHTRYPKILVLSNKFSLFKGEHHDELNDECFFNAVSIRLVAQVKISLLLKIQWQMSYNLYESFVYKFCLHVGEEVERKIGIG